MGSDVDNDLNHLRAEVKNLRADLGRITETLQSLARHGAAEAADLAQQSTRDVRDAVRGKAQGLAQEIEEKPLTAALTSFVIGVFLGTVFGGRRS